MSGLDCTDVQFDWGIFIRLRQYLDQRRDAFSGKTTMTWRVFRSFSLELVLRGIDKVSEETTLTVWFASSL